MKIKKYVEKIVVYILTACVVIGGIPYAEMEEYN